MVLLFIWFTFSQTLIAQIPKVTAILNYGISLSEFLENVIPRIMKKLVETHNFYSGLLNVRPIRTMSKK